MNITPINFITGMAAIATLPWAKLDKNDHELFGDAGEDARICHDVPLAAQRVIYEAFAIPHFEYGMIAVIGGDGLQIELHGTDNQGEPRAYAFPLAIIEH